jgi:glycosyltransferase involved in cell wall biosynthesis
VNKTLPTPEVTVVMPVRNEAAFIRRSLGAVLAQDYPAELMEVIIADGRSTDGTNEIVAAMTRQFSNVILIDNPEEIVATGLNAAIRIAKGRIVVRVDGHCEIDPDYVSRCVSALRESDYAGVGGPVETVGETYAAQVIAAAMSSRFGVGGSAFRVGVKAARLADTVPFPAYPRETLRCAGGFDEELVRNQDDEYNYRVRALGGRLLLSPDIRSRYYSRANMPGLWKQYFQYGYWKVRVLQKHPRQMQPRQFAPPLFLLWLLLLTATLPMVQLNKFLLAASLLTYAAAIFVSSLYTAQKTNWRLVLLLPVAFIALHSAYGTGFLVGLVRFWARWSVSGQVKVAQTSRDAAPL